MKKIVWIAALAGLLFGFDTGIISGAILFIQKDFGLSIFMTELLVSITLLGALIGSICSSSLVNQIGRRKALEMDAVLFIVSTLCSAWAPSLAILLLGRFAVGVAIGIACYVAPLYISELSPARLRGRMVAINTVAVTGGILISYLTSCYLSQTESWRWMLGVGFFPAAALIIGLRFLPESPRWMIKQGLFNETKELLRKIRESDAEADREYEQIKEAIKQPQPSLKKLLQPKMIKILLIGVVLAATQQVTGINTILYFAPLVFKTFGFDNAFLLTAAAGFINFIMTFIVMLQVDKVGRRNLLLFGLAGMTISLFVLSGSLELDLHWPILFSLFAFIAFYASSIGCIFWIVIAEIYPLSVRGLAMGIASGANWMTNLLMSLTFLSLLNTIGPSNTFLCYAMMGVLSFLFCLRFLPETGQYSLEELEFSFESEKEDRLALRDNTVGK